MTGTFKCRHCGKIQKKDIRIKHQEYCSKKACQQERKNIWERDKLRTSKAYREKRKGQKAHWRKKRPCYEYQKEYREKNKKYEKSNKIKQRSRNKRKAKIVKTDALKRERFVGSGLYVISPYRIGKRKKIVNTDESIVEIKSYQWVQVEEGTYSLRL